jgi:hypothetical protein
MENSRHNHRRKHIPSLLSTPSLQFSTQESHCRWRAEPPIAQSFFPCNADAPPISFAPQTQSTSRRHGRNCNPIPSSPSSAHDHHWPASHRKCRTTPPSYSSHSTRQPRLDLPMLEYFTFYAPAPPRSCDARVWDGRHLSERSNLNTTPLWNTNKLGLQNRELLVWLFIWQFQVCVSKFYICFLFSNWL